MIRFILTLQALVADRIEREDKGATMIEYGMICGLIIAVVVAAMVLLGESITVLFTNVSAAITAAF